jgi:signal transduction histidine kinase
MSPDPWWSRYGVRARVVWSTAAVTAVAMAAMVGAVALIVANLTASRVDGELRARIDGAASGLRFGAGGRLELAPSQAYDVDDSVWVFDPEGNLVTGPPSGRRASELAQSLAGVAKETTLQHDERRFLARPVAVGEHTGTDAVLVASESLRPYENTRNVTLFALLGLGLVVVAGTAALTAWTVGRTLRPVHRMTSLAAEWSEHDLETRFGLGEGSDEFTELGNTLDALLDRVATALREEQRLTSELAHELRTPLTAIRGEAELGLLRSPGDVHHQHIVELVDRLSTTITTLLAVARNQAGGHRRCDLREVVESVLDALPHPDVTVDLDLDQGRFVAAVPAELAERALAPVLENAIRYARSRITVGAVTTGAFVRVTIADDGPGVPDGTSGSVFEVGARGRGSGGAGLGLALARRIATAAGGDVSLVNSAQPTLFEVRLPRR